MQNRSGSYNYNEDGDFEDDGSPYAQGDPPLRQASERPQPATRPPATAGAGRPPRPPTVVNQAPPSGGSGGRRNQSVSSVASISGPLTSLLRIRIKNDPKHLVVWTFGSFVVLTLLWIAFSTVATIMVDFTNTLQYGAVRTSHWTGYLGEPGERPGVTSSVTAWNNNGTIFVHVDPADDPKRSTTWTLPRQYNDPHGKMPPKLAPVELNNDGLVDVVVTVGDVYFAYMQIKDGDGQGGFREPTTQERDTLDSPAGK